MAYKCPSTIALPWHTQPHQINHHILHSKKPAVEHIQGACSRNGWNGLKWYIYLKTDSFPEVFKHVKSSAWLREHPFRQTASDLFLRVSATDCTGGTQLSHTGPRTQSPHSQGDLRCRNGCMDSPWVVALSSVGISFREKALLSSHLGKSK